MKAGIALAVLAAGFLAGGCATRGTPAAAGASAVVLDAGETRAWAKGLSKRLRRSLTIEAGDPEILEDGSVLLALPASGLFEAGAAQLRGGALESCAAIAEAFNRHPGGVLHLLVSGGHDSDLEPAIRLAARRANSLHAALRAAGVPASRLRAEGREPAAGAGESIRLLLRPVVRGSEPEAWTPPVGLP